MAVETITWRNNRVKIIDQRLLPQALKYEDIDDVRQMWRAIRQLRIRGAPALGVASAFGVYLGIRHWQGKNFNAFYKRLLGVVNYLASARPTAVNLFWALELARKQALNLQDRAISEIKNSLLELALKLLKDDQQRCKAIGKFGAKLLPKRCTVLTHCNAGALATCGIGTALGIIYTAVRQGKRIEVYVNETRPLLQGARLTTLELLQARIPVTLICDNMSASLMAAEKIDAVLVGADRITRKGDFANKVGTYNLAVLAHFHKIKFYVAAPLSSFDPVLQSGKDIPIEFRSPGEVITFGGKRIAPEGVNVYNPAFDITPAKFVSAFITEKGIIYPPFSRKLRELLEI